MKKFISMVMAAAMVVSLVPATAFAYELESKVKVLDVAELAEDDAETAKAGIGTVGGIDYPELQITVTNDDYTADDTNPTYELTLKLDNAKWVDKTASVLEDMLTIDFAGEDLAYVVEASDIEDDEVTLTIKDGKDASYVAKLVEDDEIIINLYDNVKTTKTSAGSEATVSVDSEDLGVDVKELVFAVVQDNVLEIDADDTVDVAEEELEDLKEITIEAATGYLPSDINKTAEDSNGDDKTYDLKLKLSKGFEFDADTCEGIGAGSGVFCVRAVDGDTAYVDVVGDQAKIKINGLKIEATTAKAGDVATLTVSANDWEKASVEVATVVGEGLVIEVDEDEDVPEMWSGVAADTAFLADEDDNVAKTITIKETVKGAYSNKDEVELVLPEGVWVVTTDDVEGVVIDVIEGEGTMTQGEWEEDFRNAYKEGDHKSFVFEKRTLEETTDDEAFEIEVDLQLVADPGFVGDVVVELLVDGESAGEVTVATFKTPLVVEAAQNDLKIDYRNTEVNSDIVVKEAEAGLWGENLMISFDIDDNGVMKFEDDVEYAVNEESGMEIDGEDKVVEFVVEEESDEEAAVVTISNLSLFMERNIPAGAYDLTMSGNVFGEYKESVLFAPDCAVKGSFDDDGDWTVADTHDKDDECQIYDVEDFSDVAKEAFINVVTAGREADDASFTTKVVVPVGESYIVAGEQTIALDVPAYVSAAGYTMLPVRAVATGLGINNNNVLWDQATKTVTILYGQRIITMVAGQKVINVNGSVIPASASVEVVDGRAFLPMRDLATALGVTDITWDAATKTATLNGNA
ncbi:copper amine oxidase N-terminal domain-containing protein [Anaerotignum sp.]